MGTEYLPESILQLYEVREWKHACAVLAGDYPAELADILEVLKKFRLYKSHMLASGGGKSKISMALDSEFYARGWIEKKFETRIVIDEATLDSPTHKVDCFKNGVALEIEWSNKDPFYDRDLNNFRLLFDLRAISVGVIVTKSDHLRKIMEDLGVWSKYGTSTTWMQKLLPRIDGGGGGGCPVLVFGITSKLYVEDC